MKNIKLFLLLLTLFASGCAGKAITTPIQEADTWERQIACMANESGKNLSWLIDIPPDNQVVDFNLSCGNKNVDACAWVLTPVSKGYQFTVGKHDKEEIVYTAGLDTPIYANLDTGAGLVSLVLYENGHFKEKLKRHEDTHVILCLAFECDSQHKSRWYKREICQ